MSDLGPGWRSVNGSPTKVEEVPEWVASAPSPAAWRRRERIALEVAKEISVSETAACDAIEAALPVVAKLPAADRAACHNAACHAETAALLKAASASGSDVAHRRASECRAVAHRIAVKVKDPELRPVVAALLERSDLSHLEA